jgi:K(+)-stimulated pyrophosphate-energized sodium pump
MLEVWQAIRVGADEYLNRQLKTILPLVVVLTVVLFFSVYVVPPSQEALQRFSGNSPDQIRVIIGVGRAIAFVMGALFSLMVGRFGMRMAIQGSIRVAAASRKSFAESLMIACELAPSLGCLLMD